MSEPRDSNIGVRIARIACGACGTEMNPHAEKAVAPLTSAEAARADWAAGGLVEEIHQCPRCGRVESRRAP
jgi:ribosomal protein S27AE